MNKEVVRTVQVRNKLGLHARAAALFVRTASNFSSEIRVGKNGVENAFVNGKSILGVLSLAISKGSYIIIHAIGDDAEVAVEALVRLINDGFGEDE
jgi:phosphocarrier protein